MQKISCLDEISLASTINFIPIRIFVNYFTIEGVILKKDLEVCKVLYEFFSDEYNSYIYKNAIIKGCKLRSRGFKYRECNEATIAKKAGQKILHWKTKMM